VTVHPLVQSVRLPLVAELAVEYSEWTRRATVLAYRPVEAARPEGAAKIRLFHLMLALCIGLGVKSIASMTGDSKERGVDD
jgi:hypothetical protein